MTAKRDSTTVLWQVQYRKSRKHAWKTRAGRFETRDLARAQALYMREGRMRNGKLMPDTGYGFGNTRVVRYEKKGRK